MRVNDEIVNIDYNSTKTFFEHRMNKYNSENPYALTMYQDNNPKLVEERNAKEIEIIKPLLNLQSSSKVLDIACGIGRWSDAITEPIELYCGLDFCEGFIDLAKTRNECLDNRHFFVSDGTKFVECIKEQFNKVKFNVVLMMGFLMYLNDEDLLDVLKQMLEVNADDCTICIREPIGIKSRLTLKDFYSSELEDDYNVIYRTRDEWHYFFEISGLNCEYKIKYENFLFENCLNNRKETSQYFFVLERR